MTKTNPAKKQLRDLAAALRERRDAILSAWRAAGEEEPGRSIAPSLSRTQFNDHIPAVLDCLGHTLEGMPDEESDENEANRVCEHGLQRWQQGYQLPELVREWGLLQMCLDDELEGYAAAHPDLEPSVMRTARREWARLCSAGVTESATQYWRLHQMEAAAHATDLEHALKELQTLERARAEAWRTAAHDLRGSVTVVKGATTLLNDGGAAMPEPLRVEVADMLSKSVASLHDMLTDLLGLARLEAGNEQREITTFDASALLRDFCEASRPAATERGLFLKIDGPDSFMVEGDRAKILRILQNLLLNAVKYTAQGGVIVTWESAEGRDPDRWTFSVKDTGPGIDEAGAAPFAQELQKATEVTQEANEMSTDRRREIAPAATLRSASDALPPSEQPGEGVGLSIVKRLCELLEGSLELATKPESGSTFRVILPRRYETPKAA
ncbi:MAG TPA: HAMP domain-containing sensor histidine kinase [Thermoanaerobaculia bacterium]